MVITSSFVSQLLYMTFERPYLLALPIILGLFFLAFTKPQLNLLCLTFLLPFYGISITQSRFGIPPCYILAFTLIITAFSKQIILWNRQWNRVNPISKSIIIFLAVALISIVVSPAVFARKTAYGEVAWLKSFKQYALLLFMACTYFAIVFSVHNMEVYLRIIKVLIITSFLVSLYGLYQFIGRYLSLPYSQISFYNPSFGVSHGAVVFLGDSWSRLWRIWSVTPEPKHLGSFLMLTIPIILSLTINRIYLFSGHITYLVMSILIIALLLTFSAVTLYSLLLSLTLLLLLTSSRNLVKLIRNIAVMGVFLSCTILLVYFTALTARVDFKELSNALSTVGRVKTFSTDSSFVERYAASNIGIKMFYDYPIFGVGFGNYGFYYTQYRLPFWFPEKFQEFPTPKALWTRIPSELGIVGIFSALYVIYCVYRTVSMLIKQHKGRQLQSALAVGLSASALATGFFFFSTDFIGIMHAWFLIALIDVLSRISEKPDISKHGVINEAT